MDAMPIGALKNNGGRGLYRITRTLWLLNPFQLRRRQRMNLSSQFNVIFLIVQTLLSTQFPGGSAVRHEPFIKGMTVSCQTWGYEWATPEMKSAMAELKLLGVNWISIHPYARVQEDGHITFRSDGPAGYITTPIQWSAELGMHMMLKPRLAYWGTKFKWRGDIHFEQASAWAAFFSDYNAWIVNLAEIAEQEGAQILCIGTELRRSLVHESEWRQIIKNIRAVYHGKLTYAANWDNYKHVPFWDALDMIGIQAYFPLAQGENPTKTEISAGWDVIMSALQAYSTRINKKVLFTEIGYDLSEKAASEPWIPQRSDKAAARQLQESCLELALQKTGDQSFISGLFLWKWFPEIKRRHHHEDYNLQRPEIKDLLKKMWL